MIVTFIAGPSVIFILRPALHLREALMHPHRTLIQWHHDRARVFRASPDSSAMILVLPPVICVTATPDRLAVPKASEAARQPPRTPLVLL
jgi:hypothetical protein